MLSENAGERAAAHNDHIEGPCVRTIDPVRTVGSLSAEYRFIKTVAAIAAQNVEGEISFLRNGTCHSHLHIVDPVSFMAASRRFDLRLGYQPCCQQHHQALGINRTW